MCASSSLIRHISVFKSFLKKFRSISVEENIPVKSREKGEAL
jgi:hypothetical protein